MKAAKIVGGGTQCNAHFKMHFWDMLLAECIMSKPISLPHVGDCACAWLKMGAKKSLVATLIFISLTIFVTVPYQAC